MKNSRLPTPEDFERIIRNPELHARWLATLSHLESCGARKIAAFMPRCHPTLEQLKHSAEEAGHAYFFRELQARVEGNKCGPTQLLGKQVGPRYLHLLDLSISRLIRNSTPLISSRGIAEGSYLLTTYAVECRAESLYTMYEKVLRREGVDFSIKSILGEEAEHLVKMRSTIARHAELENHIKEALALERNLFSRFWSTVRTYDLTMYSGLAKSIA